MENFESPMAPLLEELQHSIIGQRPLLEKLVLGLLCSGHILIEGFPGLAKTRSVKALTSAVDLKMQRIQFTPDLLPSDVIGTEIYRPNTGEFQTRKGPIFANFVLADEINRAPAKVQSALLQAMEERQVTIGDETFSLPDPFMVLATQNPIEHEGTYPLPEAQLDRFLMKVVVGYPSVAEEVKIMRLGASRTFTSHPAIMTPAELKAHMQKVKEVQIDGRIELYIANLVNATRNPSGYSFKGMIEYGATPRGSIALLVASQALAYLRGRKFVTPDEVKEVAFDCLRHRLILSFEAESQGITADAIITKLLREVSIP